MGEALPCAPSSQEISKVLSSGASFRKIKVRECNVRVNTGQGIMESGRMPLGQVVSDCVKRWFEDTLKEAKAGDIAMQVLVGQMYCNGYGVTKDDQKGRAWINRASKRRSSALLVSDKRPGYNASDSDSEENQ